MKKTFRKAIAVLLAVLMVAFSVPFSALAATNGVADMFGSTDYTVTQNRKWWVDDGVDTSLEKLQSTPEYRGYANDDTSAGTVDFGAEFVDYASSGLEDHRNDYKPVVAATVSNLGSKQEAEAAVANGTYADYNKKYNNQYYGVNASKTYEAVKAAGNIVNPAHVKAGQRIAITVEVGGLTLFKTVSSRVNSTLNIFRRPLRELLLRYVIIGKLIQLPGAQLKTVFHTMEMEYSLIVQRIIMKKAFSMVLLQAQLPQTVTKRLPTTLELVLMAHQNSVSMVWFAILMHSK